ncbi:MAG: transglycosylase SLT domain-containing protein, partial [Pseudomonadota bacterium]
TPAAELDAFMQAHGDLAPVRRLRYRYANYLGRSRDWTPYLRFYEQHYANERLDALDCFALRAYRARGDDVQEMAARLWLVGRSQHDYCDPAFSLLKKNGVINDQLIRERLQLAIDARKFGLAGYLAGLLGDETAKATVARWREASRAPAKTLANAKGFSAAQLVYATRRLALSDAPAASGAFKKLDRNNRFSAEQRGATLRYIAIAGSQDHEPLAAALIAAVPESHRDQRLLEWEIRTALRVGNWQRVLQVIALLPDDAQASDRWRYWEAKALGMLGQTEAANGLMTRVAEERSFYGFLAADHRGVRYGMAPAALTADETLLQALLAEPAIVRVQELHAVGQTQRAAAEWQRALRTRSTDVKTQAAILAHRWGWHREAIAILGTLKLWDDLEIRYPLAFSDAVEAYSANHGVDPTFALGILRSESLYDREARSSAGAWGLMQLIPATGKRMAKKDNLRWQGIETLKNADSNIRLGTRYLGELLNRFEHPALAAAAYNAGPHRVERWLPETSAMPADVWIESIAYDETRAYVQRVLAAKIVFGWRLNSDTLKLSDSLPLIAPKESTVSALSRL